MRWPWVGLSWLVVAAISVAAVLLVGTATARSPEADQSPSTYPMTLTPYTDGRQVALRISAQPDQPLVIRGSGIATTVDCQVGATWRTGDSPIAIAGVPVVLLAAPSPWHRDLTVGDRGSDVTALQQALTDLGHEIPTSGTFDDATLSAWRKEVEQPQAAGFTVSDVVWLPSSEVTITQCPVHPSQDLQPGATIAAVAAGSPDVSFAPPRDLLVGKRALQVGSLTFDLNDDLSLSPEAVTSLLGTEEAKIALAQATDEGTQLTATLQLVEPVGLYGIPPSAIIRDDHGSCVLADGQPHLVEVISSSLGLTYVSLADPAPAQIDVFPEPGSSCG